MTSSAAQTRYRLYSVSSRRAGIEIDAPVTLDPAALIQFGQETRFTIEMCADRHAHIRCLGRTRHLRGLAPFEGPGIKQPAVMVGFPTAVPRRYHALLL